MNTNHKVVALLILVQFLAGCIQGPEPKADPADAAEPIAQPWKPHAVIAVLDTGVNPYHKLFRDPSRNQHPSGFLEGYPAEVRGLNLTFDAADYRTAFGADESKWAGIAPGELVWLPGTKFVGGIAVKGPSGRFAVLDENSHGSGIASVMLQVCPQCDILSVDYTGATAVDALRWIAQQPWIDAVSMSWAPAFQRAQDPAGARALGDALSAVWKSGKLLFAAAGNTPYPYEWYQPAGHPLVAAVGGVEWSTKGETFIASKTPELVSNYTQQVAHRDTFDSTGPGQGTSFAVPAVASVAGRVLYALREAAGPNATRTGGALITADKGPGLLADGKVTNAEVWSLLNQTAVYFETAQYRPHEYHVQNPVWMAIGVTLPILPAPFVQMGWGYQGAATAGATVEHALGKPVPSDPRKTVAAPYMAQRLAVEDELWT